MREFLGPLSVVLPSGGLLCIEVSHSIPVQQKTSRIYDFGNISLEWKVLLLKLIFNLWLIHCKTIVKNFDHTMKSIKVRSTIVLFAQLAVDLFNISAFPALKQDQRYRSDFPECPTATFALYMHWRSSNCCPWSRKQPHKFCGSFFGCWDNECHGYDAAKFTCLSLVDTS